MALPGLAGLPIVSSGRVNTKSNEIPAVCDLSRQRDLAGQALGALHVPRALPTTPLTAVRGNQRTILEDLRSIDQDENTRGSNSAAALPSM